MNKSLWKKGIAVLLTVSLTGCSSNYQKDTSTDTSNDSALLEHPETVFEDMVYEHLDTSSFYENKDKIYELMNDVDNSDLVLEYFDNMNNFVDDLLTMYSLSSLYHSFDVTDEYYAQEYSYCYDNYYQTSVACATTAKEILSSECKQAAVNEWDKNDVIFYRHYEPETPTQLELQNKEQEIILDYENTAANTDAYIVTIDGIDYNSTKLYEAYNNGTFTYEEATSYYDEITRQENEVLGQYFLDLITVRNQIAAESGYDSYADYCYEQVYYREYTTKDAQNLYRQIRTNILPLYQELEPYSYTQKTQRLDEKIANMPVNEQLELMSSYLSEIDPSLTESYDYMIRNHLYHLDYDENKFNGGYTVLISGYQEPFLLNQPEFCFYDLTSLIHEFGHFNSYYVHFEDGNDYSNLDLAEIASQGLELLYTYFYQDMLGVRYSETAIDYILYQILNAMLTGCMYDEFQQKVYQMEEPTIEKINALYYQIACNYGQISEDDSDAAAYHWVYVPHNYEYPFYYISYATSAAVSLELWELAQDDFQSTCDKYLKLVHYGEAGYFSETLEACELDSPFSRNYFKALAEGLQSYYEERGTSLKPAV